MCLTSQNSYASYGDQKRGTAMYRRKITFKRPALGNFGIRSEEGESDFYLRRWEAKKYAVSSCRKSYTREKKTTPVPRNGFYLVNDQTLSD
jgi:hypothetical protein